MCVVKEWDVFVNVNEIIVLVPALLGLKGNLDMSLASRLSTQVVKINKILRRNGFFFKNFILLKLNLGDIHDNKTTVKALVGNTALKLVIMNYDEFEFMIININFFKASVNCCWNFSIICCKFN